MYKGSERDGLFIVRDEVHAYEFTTELKREKAVKDATKIADLLGDLGRSHEHAYKALRGWVVTREEPMADQRTAVMQISKDRGITIHAISIATLHNRICNSELYVQARDRAPFGSTSFLDLKRVRDVSVPIRLHRDNGDVCTAGDLSDALLGGARALIVGDYGVGKSHALREVYRVLRKRHFKGAKLTPFPIHVNLRDCAGLRTPAEILRRHAEEIGFADPDGLISAWRAGSCILLLDGFDEIVPVRWLGGVADLKTVRWEALAPIRRLVEETPEGAGVVIAGRSHYFSGRGEMAEAVGLKAHELYALPDFDEAQVTAFLEQAGVDWTVPDWVPMRPLLLGYLVNIEATAAAGIAASTRSSGWRQFLDAICTREAQAFVAVRPDTIKEIVCRVATVARSRGDGTGPVDMELLRSAFVAVNGRQPDEEGLQLLLRLPGLAALEDGEADLRVFVDRDLAETAYGEELAAYVLNPHSPDHPLATVSSWVNAATELGIDVAADRLKELDVSVGSPLGVIATRQSSDKYDAVMADLLRLVSRLPWGARQSAPSCLVTGVYFDDLVVGDEPIFGATSFQECVIQRLDLSGVDESAAVPHFQGCLIGEIDGMPSMPSWLESKFADCEITKFAAVATTTAGIMDLSIDFDSRIALTILKKVFGQRGSARKEGALSRGLKLSDRPRVPHVLSELVSQGWLHKTSAGRDHLYVGVRDRRKDALRALESPSDFRLN